MSCIVMCDLALGQCGEIERISGNAPFSMRLQQIGFMPGERVCRAYTDARGFLSAYRVGNTLIALRRPDAELVLLRV